MTDRRRNRPDSPAVPPPRQLPAPDSTGYLQRLRELEQDRLRPIIQRTQAILDRSGEPPPDPIGSGLVRHFGAGTGNRPVPAEPLARVTRDSGSDRAEDYRGDRFAKSTSRTYLAALERFEAYVRGLDAPPGWDRPPAPAVVAEYLAHLADSGRKVSTIEHALAAISTAYTSAGFPSPPGTRR